MPSLAWECQWVFTPLNKTHAGLQWSWISVGTKARQSSVSSADIELWQHSATENPTLQKILLFTHHVLGCIHTLLYSIYHIMFGWDQCLQKLRSGGPNKNASNKCLKLITLCLIHVVEIWTVACQITSIYSVLSCTHNAFDHLYALLEEVAWNYGKYTCLFFFSIFEFSTALISVILIWRKSLTLSIPSPPPKSQIQFDEQANVEQ